MPMWIRAGMWELLAGSTLLFGTAADYLGPLSQRMIAWVMAYGGGVLLAALFFPRMDEAYRQGRP